VLLVDLLRAFGNERLSYTQVLMSDSFVCFIVYFIQFCHVL
jgi:hypothetical protein